MEILAVIIFLFFAAGCFYINHKESSRARREEEVGRMVVERMLNVIDESVELVMYSKNMKTRLSRMSVALTKCRDLIDQCPEIDVFREKLNLLVKIDSELNMEDLGDRITKHMDRANAVKSVSAKVNNACKALADIEEVSRRENVDTERVNIVRSSVNSYIHEVELSGLKDKAELFELKGNKKKAAEAYCDILFFLKKDHIDDSLQEDEFKCIEQKINELRSKSTIEPKPKSREKKITQ